MAREIMHFYKMATPLYAIVLDRQCRMWDGTRLVPFDEGLRARGAIPLGPIEPGSRIQVADMPPVPWGLYRIPVYGRAGEVPAADDPCSGVLHLEWDGKDVVALASRAVYQRIPEVDVVQFQGMEAKLTDGLLDVNMARVGGLPPTVDSMTEQTIAAAVVEALRPLLPAPLTPPPAPQPAPASGAGT